MDRLGFSSMGLELKKKNIPSLIGRLFFWSSQDSLILDISQVHNFPKHTQNFIYETIHFCFYGNDWHQVK